MSVLRPVDIPKPTTAADDPRIANLVGHGCTAETADVVLVGFPSDLGVRINGGRPGAAAGPRAIREHLYRMTPDARNVEEFTGVLERTVDLGDVEVAQNEKATGGLEADQHRLAGVLEPYLRRGAVAIVLGGGHETAFGHFLGYAMSERPIEILNWDAHPDVRVLKDGVGHSGSPFRQALEHPSGICRRYSVVGLSAHQVAAAHVSFVREHGGLAVWNDEVSESTIREIYTASTSPMMVSFDLDAVDQSAAPGVSAPSAHGLPVSLWLTAAYEAGKSRRVQSIDVVELNPAHDVDGRTARLAALTVWSFLRGRADGPSEQRIN